MWQNGGLSQLAAPSECLVAVRDTGIPLDLEQCTGNVSTSRPASKSNNLEQPSLSQHPSLSRNHPKSASLSCQMLLKVLRLRNSCRRLAGTSRNASWDVPSRHTACSPHILTRMRRPWWLGKYASSLIAAQPEARQRPNSKIRTGVFHDFDCMPVCMAENALDRHPADLSQLSLERSCKLLTTFCR
jgi:hypothetical protein